MRAEGRKPAGRKHRHVQALHVSVHVTLDMCGDEAYVSPVGLDHMHRQAQTAVQVPVPGNMKRYMNTFCA